MSSRSCSITLEIDRDADYYFLNNLRMENGFEADNAAHISLVNHLQLSWELDSDSTAVAALERQLQAIAHATPPFDFAYIEMDLDHPFGRRSGCVAVAVQSPAYLERVVTRLKTILGTEFPWQPEHHNFQPHLTISRSRSAQKSVASDCNSRTKIRGGPLTGRATGLAIWEHGSEPKYCVRVFKFADGENVVTRQADEEIVVVRQVEEENVVVRQVDEDNVVVGQVEEEDVVEKQAEEEDVAERQAEEEGVAVRQEDEEGVVVRQEDEEGVVVRQEDEEGVVVRQEDEQCFVVRQADQENVVLRQAEEEDVVVRLPDEDDVAERQEPRLRAWPRPITVICGLLVLLAFTKKSRARMPPFWAGRRFLSHLVRTCKNRLMKGS
ncbi:hypothetical protein FIBSPDRAFT_95748 [Athelia psychrophila]|uniref:Uncharacterized protein n=1 Tax=Athelia psychrophila TaxID=1759441 RepID=A0A166DSI0_9AGAM|nr:hypothetical protein FIBSPDRAFT_95748 [Fibularhizoctonia sp. CBS 109695]